MTASEGDDEINHLLEHALPGGIGRGAENQHRPAVKIIKAGVRNLRLEKIGDEPDFHALQFAGADGAFDLFKVVVAGVEDDAVDRMFVEEPRQFVHGFVVEVQFREDDQAVFGPGIAVPGACGRFPPPCRRG